MQEERSHIIEYTLIVLIIMVPLFVFIALKNEDIQFCRRVFAGLTAGSLSARKLIDWEEFNALGVDVGANYRALPDNTEKLAYEVNFVKQFSIFFRKGGGRFRVFKNWRIYRKAAAETIVAADYVKHKKTLLFSVVRAKRPKLTALQWAEDKGAK